MNIAGDLLLVMHSCLLDFGLHAITMQNKHDFTLSDVKIDTNI